MTDQHDGSPTRKGRTAHQLTVTRVRQVVPRVIAITLHGESLSSFTAPNPGGHIKIAFPSADSERPTMRTYTPRRFDPDRLELDVEFVLHGDGPAASWAASAEVGDSLTVMGPGGRYEPTATSGTFVIVVDDTAIPAAATVIEALPASTDVVALCEVTDQSDERPLSASRDIEVTWLHRTTTGAEPGELLRAAVERLPADIDADWFVACESHAMRDIRSHLRTTRQVDPERLQTRGYWRRGATNHPDHDYGEPETAVAER